MFYVANPVPVKNDNNEIEYYLAYIIDKKSNLLTGEQGVGNTPQEAVENANKLISEGKVKPIEKG